MRARLGGLTTRGRCLLAAGLAAALCAVLVNERDLLRIAAFASMLPLLSSVVVARTKIKLQAHRALLPSRASVGDDCQAHVTLRVTGRCSGRLLLEDVVPEELGGPRGDAAAAAPRDAADLPAATGRAQGAFAWSADRAGHRSTRPGAVQPHACREQRSGGASRGGAAGRVAGWR